MLKVGDICLLRLTRATNDITRELKQRYNNTEVEITGPHSDDDSLIGGISYPIKCFDGRQIRAIPDVLHKLDPPDNLVSWQDIAPIWIPKQPETVGNEPHTHRQRNPNVREREIS